MNPELPSNKLLDLDTLLWYLEGNPKLPAHIKDLIENGNGVNYVSTSTIWELSIRISNQEIQLNFPIRVMETILFQNHFLLLQPGINEFECISHLPGNLNDIFGRMLIGLCVNKNLRLITNKEYTNYQGVQIETWVPQNKL